MKSVGVVTLQRWWNYGSMLQAYAENAKINNMGYRCEIIDFNPPRIDNNRSYFMYNDYPEYRDIRKIYMEEMGVRKARFRAFEKLYVRSFNTYGSDDDIENNPPLYDAYVTGGDQIWNVNMRLASRTFFLHFTNSVEKFAFSTSVGRCKEDSLLSYVDEIKKYKKIYMRENSGAERIKNLLGNDPRIEVDTMTDPVLQLSVDEWSSIVPSKRLVEEEYILCYATLDQELYDMIPILEMLHNKHKNKKVILFGMIKPIDYDWIINKVDVGPLEFIRLIRDAEIILTHSFHGTVFSILFHKEFYTYNDNFENPRKEEILNRLKLESQIVRNANDLTEGHIDFSYADYIISEERKKAENLIRKALG